MLGCSEVEGRAAAADVKKGYCCVVCVCVVLWQLRSKSGIICVVMMHEKGSALSCVVCQWL